MTQAAGTRGNRTVETCKALASEQPLAAVHGAALVRVSFSGFDFYSFSVFLDKALRKDSVVILRRRWGVASEPAQGVLVLCNAFAGTRRRNKIAAHPTE